MEIVTPVPSRVATPTSLAVPERIFTAIRDYLAGSFASGNWGYENPQLSCYSRKNHQNLTRDLDDFVTGSMTACDLFSNHHYQEAGRILLSVSSGLKSILLVEDPHALGDILFTVMLVRRRDRNEIGMAILRQLCALGEFVVGKGHPLRLICGWLASADACHFDDIIARCLQSVIDQFESFIGPMHHSTLYFRTQCIHAVIHARDQREELLQNLLRQCELHFGSSDERTYYFRYELAYHYYDGDQFAEVMRVGQDLIAYAQNGHLDFYTLGLSLLALSQWALGQMSLAEANLRETIALRISERGTRDSAAVFWLVHLEQLLMEMGRWSCAAEAREKRMSMLDPAEIL